MHEPDHSVVGERFRLLMNPHATPSSAYPAEAAAVINRHDSDVAADEIAAWPEYCRTPLVELADIAADCGVSGVFLKDESTRFSLGSFKAVGAALGAMRALREVLEERFDVVAQAEDLRSGAHGDLTSGVVLACATDGNHGRAVAWAAAKFGCPCEVFVPRIVSAGRRAAIAALGANVTAIDGTYDDALVALDKAAASGNWVVVSDQAYPGYESIPQQIMSGYTLVAREAVDDWPLADLPTHVFVQAGVGGFAAAVCGHLWEALGAAAPRFVCVEPMAADCVYRSGAAGEMVTVPGDLETVMGCLSCGEASLPAWAVLRRGSAAFVGVDDVVAVEAMKALAFPRGERKPLAIGESGAAGVAGLIALSRSKAARRELGIDADSRVLLFATEGATDPHNYEALVGSSPASIVAGGSSDG